jgi:hypothetical protein
MFRELCKKLPMQKILIILTLFVAANGCANNQAVPGTPAAAAAAAASTSDDPAVPGPVSFSLTIDGKTFTGTSAAQFKQQNVALLAIDPDNKPEFRFYLADIKAPDGKATRTVTFQSPVKVTSHRVDCSGDDHYYGLEITFEDDQSDQYCAEDVLLNVTEVTDTRLKGNFSGHFNLIGRPRQKTIQVDCTFDIPRDKK